MASRYLTDLHPEVEKMAKEFLRLCREAGIDLLVTCTYRSAQEQNELYELGRTKRSHVGVTKARPLGLPVTRARGGQSSHNYTINGRPASLALDVVPLVGGKPMWATNGDGIDDDPTDDDTDMLELWQNVGALGTKAGLDWYGRPGAPFKEFPHFQHPRARAIRQGEMNG